MPVNPSFSCTYWLNLVFVLLVISGEILVRLFFKGIVNYPQNEQVIDPYQENPYILQFKPYILSHYPNVNYIQSRSNFSVQYKINSSGFREVEFEPISNKKRILFVGDSNVEGHGVKYSETFTNIIRNAKHDYDYEFLNLGIQGTSPFVHSFNLKRLLKLKPDEIVIFISENDWTDDRLFELNYEKLPILENPSLYDKSAISWIYNSKLIQLFYFHYLKSSIKQESLSSISKNNLNQLSKLFDNQKDLDLFTDRHFIHAAKAKINFELTEKYFNYLIEESSKNNIKISFVSLTFLIHSHGYNGNVNKDLIVRSNQMLKEYLKNKEIAYYDLGPMVEEYVLLNPNVRMFIPDDGHPTKETHQLFADAILNWFISK